MQTVTMDEARAQLPDLIEAAAHGEPFLIAQDGKPVLRVMVEDTSVSSLSVPEGLVKPQREVIRGNPNRPPMVFGTLAGKAILPDDFDRYMEDEIAEMFRIKD